jgi:hypothetical protein
MFSLEKLRRAPICPFASVNHIGDVNRDLVGQRLSSRMSRCVFFANGQIKRTTALVVHLNPNTLVTVDRENFALVILGKTVVRFTDRLFAQAVSIAVSVNQMFVIVDFSFGCTRCFRVHYAEKEPVYVSMVSEFSSPAQTRSAVSGCHLLAATVRSDTLVLWDVCSGRIHRVLNSRTEIVAFAFDEVSGVWIATKQALEFVSVNGDKLCQIELTDEISAISAVQLPSSELTRCVIYGTVNGGLFVVNRDGDGFVRIQKLMSGHSCRIQSIVIRSSLKSFVSIDSSGVAFVWTAPGLGGDPLNAAVFAVCACCWEKAVVNCRSCDRGVCQQCASHSTGGICSLCASLIAY